MTFKAVAILPERHIQLLLRITFGFVLDVLFSPE